MHYPLVGLAAAALVLPLASAGDNPRFEPLPPCDGCIPDETLIAPGFGFDISLSYGTAAVRRHDGTLDGIGMVAASPEYRDLLEHFSNPSSRIPRPPNNSKEAWYLWRLDAKKAWNRLLGRPATPEAGTVAALLTDLITHAQRRTGLDVPAAIVAIPQLPGLAREIVEDAAAFAGLTLLSTHKHIGDVTQISAGFAGSGRGLCRNYTDVDACEDDDYDFPYERVLGVNYERTGMRFVLDVMQSAYSGLEDASDTDFKLGLDALPSLEVDQPAFWATVRRHIVSFAQDSPSPPSSFVVMGDAATTPAFKTALLDALQEVTDHSMPAAPEWPAYDPLLIGARGAAEFAKRAQEAPAGCRESAECRRRRRHVSSVSSGPGADSAQAVLMPTEL